MNIATIINWLNNNRGYHIDSRYYAHIAVWTDWWRGFHPPFHRYRQVNPDGTVIERKLYSMRMAKKVCEDWASILLNEKTKLVIDDEQSRKYLIGDGDQDGGEFRRLGFWDQGNKLIEKAFYSGTGAFVMGAANMAVTGEGEVVPDAEARLTIDYLDAQKIIPLSSSNGIITEAAFVSEENRRGEPVLYLEIHEIEKSGTYCVTNCCFRAKGDELISTELPDGVAPVWHTGSPYPLFALVSPNEVNAVEHSNGLGASVFSNAIDQLQGVDLAYNNFCRDFYLGGKKVFYNKSLVRTARDAQGNAVTLAPDDVAQQLFMTMGDGEDFDDVNSLVHEFNPALRVGENRDGVQAMLDYLSFKCGLGAKHYQFNSGSVVTATQYMGDKQELVQHAAKHYITVEAALKAVARAALWIGREVEGRPVDPETEVTVQFEDGYVIDKESERLRDQQEVRDGLMQAWEYRVKWYGEDEAAAKAALAGRRSDEEWMGFGGDS